jgi:RNA polymerase sigma factor (sigma-70 family)
VGHDVEGFSEFYRDSWAPCLRAVAAWTGDVKIAEDLVAEAFAKAWASWRRLSGHPAPKAWVVRTALNTGVSWWRRRRREVHLDAQRGPAGPAGSVPALDSPDEAFASDLTLSSEDLMGAVMRLPLRERQVVALRIFLDLDTKATATQLGIAPGTVRAHLARAVNALRAQVSIDKETEVRECATTSTATT